MKNLIIVVVVLAVGAALLWQTKRVAAAGQANAALLARLQAAEGEAAAAKAERAKALQASENDPRNAEIARLRAELTALRRQQAESQAEAARLRQAVQAIDQQMRAVAADQQPTESPEREALKTVGIAKLNYGKQWALAFVLYAQEHGGRMPATLEEAATFFRSDGSGSPPSTVLDTRTQSLAVTTEVGGVRNVTMIRPDQFEIMYQGSLNELANPATTIVLREKEPFPSLARPGLSRTYVFADGHSEIHHANDGDFTAWERERMVGGAR